MEYSTVKPIPTVKPLDTFRRDGICSVSLHRLSLSLYGCHLWELASEVATCVGCRLRGNHAVTTKRKKLRLFHFVFLTRGFFGNAMRMEERRIPTCGR